MAYCIYLRKSRKDVESELHGEGDTLKRHEKALLGLSKKLNLNITKLYREVVSGDTIASRPVVQELLSDVESELWEGVLVMEIERLARGDTIDQGIMAQTFKYSNTKIITPMKTYDPNNEFDEEYFEFGLFMSRREYKTINRRLQSGRISSLKEGKYVGNKEPYGFRRVKLQSEKGYTLEAIPEESSVIKMIFNLYVYGEKKDDGSFERCGSSKIVRKLNDMKIPPKYGDLWVPSTILTMLRNPVYIGKIRWNYRSEVKKFENGQLVKTRPRNDDVTIYEGLHEAIIDKDTWNKCQDYLENNKTTTTNAFKTLKNPLAGIIYCGECGRRMVRRPYHNIPDMLMCPATGCKNVSSYVGDVEEALINSLNDWLNDYRFKIKNKVADSYDLTIELKIKEQTKAKLELNIETLIKQRNNTYDFFEQGIYTIDIFKERLSNINIKIDELQKDLESINKLIDSDKIDNKNIKEFIPKIENVINVYNSISDPMIKNQLLHEILKKVLYKKEKRGSRFNDVQKEFDLYLIPKIPHQNSN